MLHSSPSLAAYPVFPPFRSLYGIVGIRSEDLQYLRPMSYLFLCKLRTCGNTLHPIIESYAIAVYTTNVHLSDTSPFRNSQSVRKALWKLFLGSRRSPYPDKVFEILVLLEYVSYRPQTSQENLRLTRAASL